MPAPESSNHRSLTLPNGLRVVLCSAPRLKRCAAALRVAAGSHDVPSQWPGLAHFLEHLFFLGTERFPSGDNLMAFVQRHGGQVNASTRERTTDFFFELPPAVFADALDRLCEMLTHPRMTMADQFREREVLHAEFIAWSRDEASRDQIQRLQALSALHPLRGFHAGNRFSLPVPRRTFQQALQDFYRTFYQAAQMTLSLAGPQTLDELQALATRYGGYFAQGRRIAQSRAPALVDSRTPHPVFDSRDAHLMFACEGLPRGHEQAAAFLCSWMNNAQPGGLVASLRDQGLIESLTAEVVYAFDGQLLLDIDIALAEVAADQAPSSETADVISRRLFDWLAFFKSRFAELIDEYALLAQRRLAVSNALSLARHFCAEPDEPGLSSQAVTALDALIAQLTPETQLPPQPKPLKNDTFNVDWRLPEPNPFLRPIAKVATLTRPLPAFTFSDNLPGHRPGEGEAAVYLRWALSAPQPQLARMLNEGLKRLIADAQEAGITLAFTSYGNFWQLKLTGMAEPIPAVLEQALRALAQPTEETLARYGQPNEEPAPMLIRQLLRTLPDHYLNSGVMSQTQDLQRVWADARWAGLAVGLDPVAQDALKHAAQITPGKPDASAPEITGRHEGQFWETEPSDSSENAVLLFYPTPSSSVRDEAIWRLLAQLIQAPFYQRLRVELQLGYAVFSGFRQIAGNGGLLFGVQSPSASAGELVDQIESFLRTLPTQVENADLTAQINALRGQLEPATMDSQQACELIWQAHMAGHWEDYLVQLQHSLAHLQSIELLDAARRLGEGSANRLCLSNRSSPNE